MKKLLLVLITICITTPGFAQTHNSKLLFHASQPFSEESRWGKAGWVIIPNLAKVQFVGGIKYQIPDKWWIEMLGGALIANQEGTTVIDCRTAFDTRPFHFYGEVSYYFRDDPWYTYLDVNRELFSGIALLGLETESCHPDISWGPRLVVPLGKLTLIGAYQFHIRDEYENQIWIRSVIKF